MIMPHHLQNHQGHIISLEQFFNKDFPVEYLQKESETVSHRLLDIQNTSQIDHLVSLRFDMYLSFLFVFLLSFKNLAYLLVRRSNITYNE